MIDKWRIFALNKEKLRIISKESKEVESVAKPIMTTAYNNSSPETSPETSPDVVPDVEPEEVD